MAGRNLAGWLDGGDERREAVCPVRAHSAGHGHWLWDPDPAAWQRAASLHVPVLISPKTAHLSYTLWLYSAFYWEYRMEEEVFLLLVLFRLSIRKDCNIWRVSSRTCLGSEKVKKKKGSISQLPSSPPPQISAPLFFFLALWALLLKPASSCFCPCRRWASTASCFPGECWRRESLRPVTYIAPNFFYYYVCVEVYMYTF